MRQYFDDDNFPEWTKSQPGITVPLTLPELHKASPFASDQPVTCLFCEIRFVVPRDQQKLLQHFLEDHHFVIAEVQMISNLAAYLEYWRAKFQERPLIEYCAVMKSKVNNKTDENFYLLSDVIEEDKQLRIQLQMQRLEYVLDVHERERKDTSFSRQCLFCRTMFEGQYSKLFDHMAFDHNFSVGQPDNLVFVNELLDVLEYKLENLFCIFCENKFKSRDVLKEHMRKKSHKKINPKNKAYDKFYLVNYLEFGKNWETVSKERDFEEDELPTGFDSDEENENDWSDWRGDLSGGAVCLFCPAAYTHMKDYLEHMKIVHKFDYDELRKENQYTFYQQVRSVLC